ncbi:MAG: glycosyltransferase family 4 protein [Gemmatimonadota bacterium]
MNIVMHCVYFPPEVGGLESHVYYLGRALVRAGHSVAVVTSRSLPEAPAYEVMEGIEVYRTWFPARNPVGWMVHAAGSVPVTRRLAYRADIIHAQAFQSVPPCALARRGRKVPLVATLHTSHFLMRAQKPAWKPVLKRIVTAPDHVFAASGEIAAVAESLAPGVRVEPLTNGVETDLFRPVKAAFPPGSRRRIVVPRRLFPKNGVEYFIRALPTIVAGADVEALLVGDGPERERLEQLAQELGVADRVRFLGRQPNEEMPSLLCSAELAVFPSLMEATSVAALESMACERPVAASRVGGLPEIVDDEVGGLFAPADPEDLARVVLGLLRRPDLRELGARGRQRVESHWSNRRLAERHLDVYQDLLRRARGHEWSKAHPH